jgi:hypothetical protein
MGSSKSSFHSTYQQQRQLILPFSQKQLPGYHSLSSLPSADQASVFLAESLSSLHLLYWSVQGSVLSCLLYSHSLGDQFRPKVGNIIYLLTIPTGKFWAHLNTNLEYWRGNLTPLPGHVRGISNTPI